MVYEPTSFETQNRIPNLISFKWYLSTNRDITIGIYMITYSILILIFHNVKVDSFFLVIEKKMFDQKGLLQKMFDQKQVLLQDV